jgi:hypothetical protein
LKAIQSASENGLTKVVPIFVIRPEKEEEGRVHYSRTAFFSPHLNPVAGFANAPIDPDGFVRQVPLAVRGADGKVLASLAFAVVASVLLTLFRPTTVTVIAVVAIPLLSIPLSYLAFARLGIWVDFATPPLAIWLGGVGGDILDRKRVRRSFNRYVDGEAVDQIVHQEESLKDKRNG